KEFNSVEHRLEFVREINGFIRSYEYYGKKIKEGFYSPVTQNQRHLQLIHDVVMNHKKNAIMRLAFDHWFSDYYQSLVVLANPKNCIRNYSKDKQISQQVIRADQLISTIKKMNRNAKIDSYNQKDCLKIAENFMEWNVEKADAWQTAFEKSVPKSENDKEETQGTEQDIKICPRCGGKLVVRKAKKGIYIGNSFYGCENYPKCRYIQNITVDTSKK
ncbi:topoisomerase DNA-binding C4 zinc finger domain-containing protein, partial [uncultured Ruminococcus sp.]|uniref:topoisomerase DNA-binding C4 zinc finger domain-containing protein n=1 Tax=uncultured Ruminococcus sp. TaxID=165186 RepID=UPI00265DE5C1